MKKNMKKKQDVEDEIYLTDGKVLENCDIPEFYLFFRKILCSETSKFKKSPFQATQIFRLFFENFQFPKNPL
jgi:hypothetical protein